MERSDPRSGISSEIIVREAQAGDAETLARFNEAMAQETEGLRLDPRTIRAGVEAVIGDPAKGFFLVAERQGAVAGGLLITFEWSDWRNGQFLWLQSVYVDPAHRRRGVFKALFSEVERRASAPGRCGLRLYMDAHNDGARAAYERLGLEHRGYLVFESQDGLRR